MSLLVTMHAHVDQVGKGQLSQVSTEKKLHQRDERERISLHMSVPLLSQKRNTLLRHEGDRIKHTFRCSGYIC